MKHPSVQSSEETIAKALTGDWRVEHLFTLRQAVELYDTQPGRAGTIEGSSGGSAPIPLGFIAFQLKAGEKAKLLSVV